MNGSQGNVELVGAAPVSEVRSVKHAVRVAFLGVKIALSKWMVACVLGNLHVLNKTLSSVGLAFLARVKVNLE